MLHDLLLLNTHIGFLYSLIILRTNIIKEYLFYLSIHITNSYHLLNLIVLEIILVSDK